MTTQELLAKYNPANAHNLSQADLATMRDLTTDQIKELAAAYPNDANRKPYLILFDTKLAANKQLFPLSTWQNLYNVRKFSNMKNLQSYTFKELFAMGRTPSAIAAKRTGSTVAKSTTSARKVVDLSASEAADELKKSMPPVRTMVAKTIPEPEETVKAAGDNAGASIEQPVVKSATSRSARKAANVKKAEEAAKAETNTGVPADQQLADLGGDGDSGQ